MITSVDSVVCEYLWLHFNWHIFVLYLESDTINLFCTKYWAVNNLVGVTPNDPVF